MRVFTFSIHLFSSSYSYVSLCITHSPPNPINRNYLQSASPQSEDHSIGWKSTTVIISQLPPQGKTIPVADTSNTIIIRKLTFPGKEQDFWWLQWSSGSFILMTRTMAMADSRPRWSSGRLSSSRQLWLGLTSDHKAASLQVDDYGTGWQLNTQWSSRQKIFKSRTMARGWQLNTVMFMQLFRQGENDD